LEGYKEAARRVGAGDAGSARDGASHKTAGALVGGGGSGGVDVGGGGSSGRENTAPSRLNVVAGFATGLASPWRDDRVSGLGFRD